MTTRWPPRLRFRFVPPRSRPIAFAVYLPRMLPLLVAGAAAGCAGIVGIGDVPDGDGGLDARADGTPFPIPDGDTNPFDVHPHSDAADDDVGDDAEDGDDDDGSGPGDDSSTPTSDGGSLPFAASNLGGKILPTRDTGSFVLAGDECTLYTEMSYVACESGYQPSLITTTVSLAGGAGEAFVYVFTYISIDSESTLKVTGHRPIILVALDSVDIRGTVDVSADNFDPDSSPTNVPGAFTAGSGVGGFKNAAPKGGGGGAFCGKGGAGAASSGAGWPGGLAYGTANLIPLLGGSAGGGEGDMDPDGIANGNGGGAVQISAAQYLTVHTGALITVDGSGAVAQGSQSGAGGGSGGGILLEAPTVTIAGALQANGGQGSDVYIDGDEPPADGGSAYNPECAGGAGGAGSDVAGSEGETEDAGYGGGGGGVGWVRLNGTTVSITGLVSPPIGSVCGSKGPLP